METRRVGFAVVPVALALLASACGGGGNASSTSSVAQSKNSIRQQNREAAVTSSMTVSNQSSTGSSVTVASITIKDTSNPAFDGRLSVASDVSGKPGTVLASVTVKEGTHTNVKIPVSAALTTGKYWVLLEPATAAPTSVATPLTEKLITVTVPAG